MSVFYRLGAVDDRSVAIEGCVEIESSPKTGAQLTYRIVSCCIVRGTDGMSGAGLLRFSFREDGVTPLVDGADWELAQWQSSGFGVWFQTVDGGAWPTDRYHELPPRIELTSDMLGGGPFQPVGRIRLVVRADEAGPGAPGAPQPLAE
jgi:hypothetical protein